eukprot:129210_1
MKNYLKSKSGFYALNSFLMDRKKEFGKYGKLGVHSLANMTVLREFKTSLMMRDWENDRTNKQMDLIINKMESDTNISKASKQKADPSDTTGNYSTYKQRRGRPRGRGYRGGYRGGRGYNGYRGNTRGSYRG